MGLRKLRQLLLPGLQPLARLVDLLAQGVEAAVLG
jgi:hypothetical protein